MVKGKSDQSPEAISLANEEAKQEIHLVIAKICHSYGDTLALRDIVRMADPGLTL
jgi:hypothetical protein